MNARERKAQMKRLEEKHPGRFISTCTIWTPGGTEAVTVASHEPMVGTLLLALSFTAELRGRRKELASQLLKDLGYTPGDEPAP